MLDELNQVKDVISTEPALQGAAAGEPKTPGSVPPTRANLLIENFILYAYVVGPPRNKGCRNKTQRNGRASGKRDFSQIMKC